MGHARGTHNFRFGHCDNSGCAGPLTATSGAVRTCALLVVRGVSASGITTVGLWNKRCEERRPGGTEDKQDIRGQGSQPSGRGEHGENEEREGGIRTGAAETRVARKARERREMERRMRICRAEGIVAAGRGDVTISWREAGTFMTRSGMAGDEHVGRKRKGSLDCHLIKIATVCEAEAGASLCQAHLADRTCPALLPKRG